MAPRNRKAFTLVELLVVIVIIGMLMALLLPAIARSRAQARRAQCVNLQQELGKACMQYEIAKGYLPGYVNRLGATGTDTDGDGAVDEPDETAVSWVVMVFQYLGEGDLWKKWRNPNVSLADKVDPAKTDKFAAVTVRGLTCPADDPEGIAPLSYVANCGLSNHGLRATSSAPNTGDVLELESVVGSADKAANAVKDSAYGLFFNHWIDPRLRTKVTMDKITDGAQNTIMLSENRGASQWATISSSTSGPRPPRQFDVGILWWSEKPPFGPVTPGDGRKINDDPEPSPGNPVDQCYVARPSSAHSGGVVVTFADGHSGFQDEDIDYNVYQSLMTPQISKAVKQGLVSP